MNVSAVAAAGVHRQHEPRVCGAGPPGQFADDAAAAAADAAVGARGRGAQRPAAPEAHRARLPPQARLRVLVRPLFLS